jgi:hypothetical protein
VPIQVAGAMSGTDLSRVRTEFRLRLPERINQSPLESRGPTLLCNQVRTGTHISGKRVNQEFAAFSFRVRESNLFADSTSDPNRS